MREYSKAVISLIIIIMGFTIVSCIGFSESLEERKMDVGEENVSTDHDCPDSWAYWLQNIRLEELTGTPFDLVVIDYSRDGSRSGAFSAQEIRTLKKEGKTVLAYFSIGEAEEYRFYWEDTWQVGKPSFIGPENPEWPENYKVKYWDPQWWDVALKPYLDRIINADFDGVYLDLVDAYYYWGMRSGGSDRMRRYADLMISLILRVAEYGRSRSGEDFSVCIQNGLAILTDSTPERAEALLAALSYTAVESLFYNTTPAVRDIRLALLDMVHKADIPVLNVEYIPVWKRKEYVKLLSGARLPIGGFAADADRSLDHPPQPLPKR